MSVDPARLLASWTPEARARLLIDPESVADPQAIQRAMGALSGPVRELADTLRLALEPGEPVPPRFRAAIESVGDELWWTTLLLPRSTPSSRATIDPRHYAGACRLNPALSGRFLDPVHGGQADPVAPSPDARWDAHVIAAALEQDPLRLTRGGTAHRDDERRLIDRLGGAPERWRLAWRLAQEIGLARRAAGAMRGFPERRGRPVKRVANLFESPITASTGALLLRVVDQDWVSVDALVEQLQRRTPTVLPGWSERAVHDAAQVLHRCGLLEGGSMADGGLALRTSQGGPPVRDEGWLVTSDWELLVPPWAVSAEVYGRLNRLAPYVDGDVVHRHRVTAEGVSAEVGCGHHDAVEFLADHSRNGLPANVREVVQGWGRTAGRIVLRSGVTVVERDGRFRLGTVQGARVLDYADGAPGLIRIQGGEVQVPFGQDGLPARALASRLGTPLPASSDAWRWRLGPAGLTEPAALLTRLEAVWDGPLPSSLRVAVYAAAGWDRWAEEPSVILRVAPPVADALVEDLGGLVLGRLDDERLVVADVQAARARLRAMGLVPTEGG